MSLMENIWWNISRMWNDTMINVNLRVERERILMKAWCSRWIASMSIALPGISFPVSSLFSLPDNSPYSCFSFCLFPLPFFLLFLHLFSLPMILNDVLRLLISSLVAIRSEISDLYRVENCIHGSIFHAWGVGVANNKTWWNLVQRWKNSFCN